MEIDGVVYMGVTSKQKTMGIHGDTILDNVKKQGIHVIQGRQKNRRAIQLIPLSFIEELKKRQK